jgi:hypothetical protein
MPLTELTLETPFLTGLYEPWEGKHTLRDCYVNVGSIDVSRLVHNVRADFKREAIDITSFTTAGYREYMPGKASGTFSFEMFYDPTVLTPTWWAALKTGAVWVEVRPHNAPVAPGNPGWMALCVAATTRSLFGDVGEAAASIVVLHSTGEIEELLA